MTSRPALAALLCAALVTWTSTAGAHGDAGHAQAGPPQQKDWGIAASPAAALRTIELSMNDTMRFSPDHITVREGETVRLRLHNRGKLLHEFVIGTADTLEDHAAMMLEHPDMKHNDAWMVHVPPGRRGSIAWTFNRTGEFEFACLIAGHFQAGMKGTISVVAR